MVQLCPMLLHWRSPLLFLSSRVQAFVFIIIHADIDLVFHSKLIVCVLRCIPAESNRATIRIVIYHAITICDMSDHEKGRVFLEKAIIYSALGKLKEERERVMNCECTCGRLWNDFSCT